MIRVVNENRAKPPLELSAGSGYFDQATYDEVTERLRPYFRVSGGLSIELTEIVDPHVVAAIAISIQPVISPSVDILKNLIASALYDGLKTFLRPKEEPGPRYEFLLED